MRLPPRVGVLLGIVRLVSIAFNLLACAESVLPRWALRWLSRVLMERRERPWRSVWQLVPDSAAPSCGCWATHSDGAAIMQVQRSRSVYAEPENTSDRLVTCDRSDLYV